MRDPGATLGIDLGTSGVRAVVLGAGGIAAQAAVPIAPAARRDPAVLWGAVRHALAQLPLGDVAAAAVAGTSGTILAVDATGDPRSPLSLYNDAADPAHIAQLDHAAPPGSPARGHTSPLARALHLATLPGTHRILHEADWIAGRLCGEFATTDETNALKTGYDPATRAWPHWIAALGLAPLLPRVVPPGTRLAPAAAQSGLPRTTIIAAGITDGCASFLSASSLAPGAGVTVLGSTITLKLLSPAAISAPAHGIYSHRLWDRWLAGGASNAGGAVLAALFTPAQLATLSARIEPATPSGLDYYPLPAPGERFPIADPALPPRLLPRPADDAQYLHGLLDGLATIEAQGYALLHRLGAPAITHVTTLGGGAANPAWQAIRARRLGVPVDAAPHASAAHGAALVARRAVTAGQ